MKFFRMLLVSTLTLCLVSAAPVDNTPVITLPPGAILEVDQQGLNHIVFPISAEIAVEMAADQIPPRFTWLTEPNAELAVAYSSLEAEIADAGSGICLVELSLDNGRNWQETWNARSFPLNKPIRETPWSYTNFFADLPAGTQVVIGRAVDCAGNTGVGQILVVQIEE